VSVLRNYRIKRLLKAGRLFLLEIPVSAENARQQYAHEQYYHNVVPDIQKALAQVNAPSFLACPFFHSKTPCSRQKAAVKYAKTFTNRIILNHRRFVKHKDAVRRLRARIFCQMNKLTALCCREEEKYVKNAPISFSYAENH
jgi:hypothetical protein